MQLATQAKVNIKTQECELISHQNEIKHLKSDIKIKSNEIRKMKISKALIRSKNNPKNRNMIEKNNDESTDQRSMHRSVKAIMDILEIESNQNIVKQKEILSKIAEKINCPDLINSTILSTTDVGNSIIKFSRTMWSYVNNEVIKNALNTVILAAVTYSEITICPLASLFGINRQNSILLAAYGKKKTFDGPDLGLENLKLYIKNRERNKRKDALSDDLGLRASTFWENNCEVSPNMKDVCRHRIDKGPWIEHIKHFQYDTEAELLKKFLETGEMIGIKNFHACKPWFIYNGPMNTCVCVKCLNIQLIKESVAKNKNILRSPYRIKFACKVIVNFFRANLMVCRVKKNYQHNIEHSKEFQKLDNYKWYQIINALTLNLDVYDICQGK